MNIAEIVEKYGCSEQTARRTMKASGAVAKSKKGADSMGRTKMLPDYSVKDVAAAFKAKNGGKVKASAKPEPKKDEAGY